MDSLDGYVSDDQLAVGPLAQLGWDVRTISWRDPSVDWNDFDLVVIRTTWDYQHDAAAFLDVLETIESGTARLENPLSVVKWNLDKRYLRELAKAGAPVVPTIWDAAYTRTSFDGWLDDLACDELIVKPTVSATAEHTYRLRSFEPGLTDVFSDRPFMVQPFVPAIVTEGEYSLFYFNGDYSHTILKTPKPADFRVQEEHGGIITAVSPGDELLKAGAGVFEMIAPVPLYARVDLVRDAGGGFLLMELELIEPALYLRMDPLAPARFAMAIDDLMKARI
jgi:glutathione synthase/RimK-type ligase-like ATP-grasp enzyme